ncbi:hypothetical protein KEM56_005560 [Ascosphaera pollenicola]|nr:hypothetical protein KEM56_005560 [Ascosphaera pollenicola]
MNSPPIYCIPRPQGTVTPLIPLDELPPFVELPGVYRETNVDAPHGGSYSFNGMGNLIDGDAAAWHRKYATQKPQKEYCSHWIRTGECSYTQQGTYMSVAVIVIVPRKELTWKGCKFKHEMPMDLATLEKLGHRDIPRWYQMAFKVPSLVRPALNNNPPNRLRLDTLPEDHAHFATSMAPPQPQTLLALPRQLHESTSSTSLMSNMSNMNPPSVPWATTTPAPMLAPQPQRSITAFGNDMSIGRQNETPSNYSWEAISENTNPSPENGGLAADIAFPHPDPTKSLFLNSMWSTNQQDRQLQPAFQMAPPPLRRTNENTDLRRAISTRDVSAFDNNSFPYRLGLPALSSPNLASQYRSMAPSARPSMHSLASEGSGTHFASRMA